MKVSLDKIGVSRKVVGYYLFFCVVAVAWLSIGVLTTTRGVLSNRAASHCLSRLGHLAAAIEMDMLREEGASTQRLVEQAQAEARLAYCCVVGVDGRYAAHTTRPLVGAPASEPTGARLSWGAVEGVRYTSEVHGILSEYRAPLRAGDQDLGSLRLAVIEPRTAGVLREIADIAPLAILLPLACVVVGAVLLRRLIRPMVSIEQRLCSIAATPHGEPLPLERVDASGLVSAGWNRLAEHAVNNAARGEDTGIQQRLAATLAARRGARSLGVLDGLSEGIAVTDAAGRIEFANAAIASLLEAEAEDAIGLGTITDALDAASAGGAVPFGDTKGPVTSELESGRGEAARTLRVERQPLGDEQGRAVWSIRDITQQKLAERSRDQFIDAATHELRTPLANIKAYAETLAACDIDDAEQQKEFCNTINSEATRLARFVDDLLDISSMEVGSLTIRRQNVDVERLLREAADKVRPLLAKKSQQFEVVIPPKLGEMQLDKDKAAALIVNLLGNATKYTPEGGRVRFKAEAGDGALKLSIADTGVGIAPDELPRVFEKFFRSEDPAVRGEAGTGLGLSLAREIARLHGGDVTAESVVGEGSTFTITLPRAEGAGR
ncbi:MAG: ATP-binding protein [Planctomycetota bacterium]